jgi:NAD-dependent dihydropyrimidine dehydrogenase PreA subunit
LNDDKYWEVKSLGPQGGNERMWKVTVDKEKCTGDGECADVCPVDVYQLVEGRAEPVNEDDCLGCESCIEVCDFDAITVEEV